MSICTASVAQPAPTLCAYHILRYFFAHRNGPAPRLSEKARTKNDTCTTLCLPTAPYLRAPPSTNSTTRSWANQAVPAFSPPNQPAYLPATFQPDFPSWSAKTWLQYVRAHQNKLSAVLYCPVHPQPVRHWCFCCGQLLLVLRDAFDSRCK